MDGRTGCPPLSVEVSLVTRIRGEQVLLSMRKLIAVNLARVFQSVQVLSAYLPDR